MKAITDPATLEIALEHGLTEEEYEKIQEFLGRVPNITEVGIYSAMWSEHCSYKNSILLLKTFPTESDRSLSKTGEENAGVLDIGDGLAVVFKVESHNHPTAVEPYQGAATGVGGIMRDIFTMGARPMVTLNSLRFGPPTESRNQFLLSHAVKGIGDYGNSLGITVSGGELFFDESFNQNPLVNAMTVGIVRQSDLKSSVARGVGNPVLIIGATTGRDGIHGASFASTDLTEESESKRSAVQVGDPFMEKLLLEATLELIQGDYIEAIQDMGAAGLSCSSSEMAAKGQLGMRLDLDKVPVRETGMNAYEIMLSESQERMLVIAKPDRVEQIIAIMDKWDLQAVQIGTLTADGNLVLEKDGIGQASIPADSLVLGGGAPRYKREQSRPAELEELLNWSVDELPELKAGEVAGRVEELLSSPNLQSKRPVYDQYDTTIGNGTLVSPGGDGGLHRVPGTDKALATSLDCNSRYVRLNPWRGAAQAVFESSRNLAVRGARVLGITNCLNFANPYKPENYYFFAESIRGIGDACRKLEIPVTGGNVSFYNESPSGPVFPTPTIGTVGLLEDYRKGVGSAFRRPGQEIWLVGHFHPGLGGSEYLAHCHQKTRGDIPKLDMDEERRYLGKIPTWIEEGLLASASDISMGGLLMTILKCRFEMENDSLARREYAESEHWPGLDLDLAELIRAFPHRLDEILFGETGASYIVSTVDEESSAKLVASLEKENLSGYRLGRLTEGNRIILRGEGGAEILHQGLSDWSRQYHRGLNKFFEIDYQ